jgi:multicomponent Na+:H+ antiporter subunit E
MYRITALAVWCFAVWLLLVWTVTVEAAAVGVTVSVGVAAAVAPLGPVVAPWRLLAPRRLAAIVRLGVAAGYRVVRANIWLARIIWSPRMPLATGMVVVPTRMRTDGGLAAVGVISSLAVDNQLVDLDRSRHELLYHCVVVPPQDERYESINGELERRIEPLVADRD